MEPLIVAVHAVSSLSKLRAGQRVAVSGCGPVGLLCVVVSRALRASRILAVDTNKARLDFSISYAATDAYHPPPRSQNETKLAYPNRLSELMKAPLALMLILLLRPPGQKFAYGQGNSWPCIVVPSFRYVLWL